MRFLAIACAAILLLIQSVAPSQAHHSRGGPHAEDAYAAAKKKAAKSKGKKRKEQYMRAVPSR